MDVDSCAAVWFSLSKSILRAHRGAGVSKRKVEIWSRWWTSARAAVYRRKWPAAQPHTLSQHNRIGRRSVPPVCLELLLAAAQNCSRSSSVTVFSYAIVYAVLAASTPSLPFCGLSSVFESRRASYVSVRLEERTVEESINKRKTGTLAYSPWRASALQARSRTTAPNIPLLLLTANTALLLLLTTGPSQGPA